MPQEKVFNKLSDFTNLYEVNKTLRFELKPVGKTKNLLEQNKVLEKDKLIDDNYHKIKYYFDLLHRKFINEALSDVKINFGNYYKIFQVLDKKDEEKKKDFRDEERKLREELVKKINQKAEEWKKTKYSESFKIKELKSNQKKEKSNKEKDGIEIFFGKNNLEILKIEFPEKPQDDSKAPDIDSIDPKTKENKNLFESFRGFTTYFSNFNQSRKNFYSDKDNDTAISNRVINENLRRFCENKKLFNEREKEYEKIDLNKSEKGIFELDFYNSCLTQEGIKKYNEIIGRKAEKENEGDKGLDQKINEYRQKTKEKLPFFKELFNQILSEKDATFHEIEITNDEKAFETLKEFIKINDKKIKEAKILLNKFFDNQDEYDLGKIYLKKAAINTISRKFFGENWQYFENALPHKETFSKEEKYKLSDFVSIKEIKDALLGNQKELPKKWKYLGKIEKEMSPKDLFREQYASLVAEDNYQTFLNVWRYEFKNLINDETENDYLKNESYKRKKEELEKEIIAKGKINKNRIVPKEKSNGDDLDITEISIIKMYTDSALKIYRMTKYFALEKGKKKVEELASDNNFYGSFDEYYRDYPIIAYYNEFRNYLTKKDFLGRLLFPAFGENREQKNPLSKRNLDGAEKIKLNFECGYLLGGWAQKFETFGALLFLKNEKYYLGVINGAGFDEKERQILYQGINSENIGKRLVYKMQKIDFKNCPRLFINSKGNKEAPAVKKYNLPVGKIWNDYQEYRKCKSQKEKNKYLSDHPNFRYKLIDYFKYCLPFHDDLKDFKLDLKWKETKDYDNLNQFYHDTIDSCYKIDWEKINYEALLKLVEQDRIYLFQVYNKDFGNIKENSQKNIHTSLFLELLNPVNSKVLRLMGGGEIFFRPKNERMLIRQKDGKDLKFIDKRNGNKEKRVLEHRRYAEDKIFLHFPIGIVGRNLEEYLVNKKINEYLLKKMGNKKTQDEIKIIGIDRGEKNLAYYSIVEPVYKDEKIISGKMIDGGSFNEIEMRDKNGKIIKKVNYLDLLKKKAVSRDEARKNWQTIANIKELKKGYVSQVVRKICDLILNHKAIVIFEDLNVGFKRSRSALDFPIYQKLELDLIKKLNYLVNKNAKEGEAGHCLRGYQLAPMVVNPQDIGKQTGIVFYTPAGYTSKTCPKCGFRRNNNKFYFETIKKAKEILGKLKAFEYDSKEKRFRIEYNLSDFLSEEEKNKEKRQKNNKNNELFTEKERKEEFVVYSNVNRYRWHNKETERAKREEKGEEKIKNTETERGLVKKYDITECLIGLFGRNGINYQEADLKTNILSKNIEKDFYKDLLYYLNLILEIRNSWTDKNGEGDDYIQCPACGFHSDGKEKPKEIELVKNGDANGAYNIARKGIMILEKIKQFADNNKEDLSKLDWKDLAVSIGEWDKFVQK